MYNKKLIVEATITKTVKEKLVVNVNGVLGDDVQAYLDDAYCTKEGWELIDVGTIDSEFEAAIKLVDKNYSPEVGGAESPTFDKYYDEYRLRDDNGLNLTDYERGFLKCYVMTLKYDGDAEDVWQQVTVQRGNDEGRTFDINFGFNKDYTFWATAYECKTINGMTSTDGMVWESIEGEMKDD